MDCGPTAGGDRGRLHRHVGSLCGRRAHESTRAAIVVDRFHVMKNLQAKMQDARRAANGSCRKPCGKN